MSVEPSPTEGQTRPKGTHDPAFSDTNPDEEKRLIDEFEHSNSSTRKKSLFGKVFRFFRKKSERKETRNRHSLVERFQTEHANERKRLSAPSTVQFSDRPLCRQWAHTDIRHPIRRQHNLPNFHFSSSIANME